jgi:hypothetical protein
MKKIKMFIQRSLNFFKKNTTPQLIKEPNFGLTNQAAFLLKPHNTFRNIYSFIVFLLLISTTFSQNTLRIGTSVDSADSGSTTSSKMITVTHSLSNQQYPSGTFNGTSPSNLAFGESVNNSEKDGISKILTWNGLNGITSGINYNVTNNQLQD